MLSELISADGTRRALMLSEPDLGEIGVIQNFLPKDKLAAK